MISKFLKKFLTYELMPLQETEIESYVIGGVKQDVKKDQFKTFKL